MLRVCSVLIESLVEHPEERLVLGGTANLTRNATDFPGSLRNVLEALEEQVVVLKLLAAAQDQEKVGRDVHRRTAGLLAQPHQLAVDAVIAHDGFEFGDPREGRRAGALGGGSVRRVQN